MFIPPFSWHDVMHHQKIHCLSYVPLLDAAGILLRGAGLLWQTAWPDVPGVALRYFGGRPVAAKIAGFGSTIAEHTTVTLRDALVWLEPAVLAHHREFIEVDDEACGPLLADHCVRRGFRTRDREVKRSPEGGRLLTGAGLAMFVEVLRQAAAVEDGLGRKLDVSQWANRLDEFLVVPGVASCQPPNEAAIDALRRWGLLRLAEDLAYAGSTIESGWKQRVGEDKSRCEAADRRHAAACAAYESFVELATPHEGLRQSLRAVADISSGYPFDCGPHWSTKKQVQRSLELLDGLVAAIDAALASVSE